MTDVIGIGNFLLRIIDVVVRFLSWLRAKMGRNGPGERVPALGVVYEKCRVTPGEEAGKPALHLMADYLLTNNTEQTLAIVRSELTYGKWLCKRTINQAQFRSPIPPRGISDVRILFRIAPPPVPENRVLRARVRLIDNLGRLHDGGTLLFRPRFTGPD